MLSHVAIRFAGTHLAVEDAGKQLAKHSALALSRLLSDQHAVGSIDNCSVVVQSNMKRCARVNWFVELEPHRSTSKVLIMTTQWVSEHIRQHRFFTFCDSLAPAIKIFGNFWQSATVQQV